MRHPHLPAAIMWKYGAYVNELTCLDGEIEQWPTETLGAIPTDTEQQQCLDEYQAWRATPPPETPLERAITRAVTDVTVGQPLADALLAIQEALRTR